MQLAHEATASFTMRARSSNQNWLLPIAAGCLLATLMIGCMQKPPIQIPIFVDHGGSNVEPSDPDPDGDDMIP